VRTVDWVLRAESLALFAAGVALYLQMSGNALWLLPLLLVPDISMIGYVGGPRLGAITYNLAHNLVTAFAVLAIGWFAAIAPLALAGAVLAAHVGMDRTLGYGLKLPTDFRDTHLGRIGR
jgi:sorbitol-specific phosphotransferase system component IIC